MDKSKNMTIDRIIQWIIIGFFAVVPLFFLPFTQDFYNFNKWALLMVTTFLLVLLSAYSFIKSRRIFLTVSPLTLSLSFMTLASLVSLIISSSNKVEAATSLWGTGTFAAITLIVLLGKHLFDEDGRSFFKSALFASASIASLIAIYQYLGLGKQIFPQLGFLQNPAWTPLGNPLWLIVLLILPIPLLLEQLFKDIKSHNTISILTHFLVFIILVTGLFISLIQSYQSISKNLLPLGEGVRVLGQTLRKVPYLFTGVGAENFQTAFQKGRTIAFNKSALWNQTMENNSSFILHLGTIYGLLGLIGALLFIFSLITTAIRTRSIHGRIIDGLTFSMIVGTFVLVLLPPSFPVFLSLIALTYLYDSHDKIISISPIKKNVWIALSFMFIAAIGAFTLLIWIVQVYRAEVEYLQSVKAALRNDGKETYNRQLSAVTLNPYKTQFHLAYSRTNLVLADTIINSIKPQTSDIKSINSVSEENRTAISQFTQQAVREAKLAIKLAPDNSDTWENIGLIYRNISRYTQGADQWTIASFQRAIQLDSNNPALHLSLGSVYVDKQEFNHALEEFQKAAILKPNWPNAWYNLGLTQKELKQNLEARKSLQKAISFVPAGSSDYQRIEREIQFINNDLK